MGGGSPTPFPGAINIREICKTLDYPVEMCSFVPVHFPTCASEALGMLKKVPGLPFRVLCPQLCRGRTISKTSSQINKMRQAAVGESVLCFDCPNEMVGALADCPPSYCNRSALAVLLLTGQGTAAGCKTQRK